MGDRGSQRLCHQEKSLGREGAGREEEEKEVQGSGFRMGPKGSTVHIGEGEGRMFVSSSSQQKRLSTHPRPESLERGANASMRGAVAVTRRRRGP